MDTPLTMTIWSLLLPDTKETDMTLVLLVGLQILQINLNMYADR